MLSTLISELRSTTKPKEKQAILKSHEGFPLTWAITATYEPFVMYHVKLKTSDCPLPGNMPFEELLQDIMDVLNWCATSNSSKKNKAKIIELLEDLDNGSQELVLAIVAKNWKAGLGVRNILKVFPNIVSRFEVQLANTYKPDKKYEGTKRIASYKLDGIRGIALRLDGEWVFRTRQGKEILTCDHIKPDLEVLYETYGYTMFDGELFKMGLKFEQVQGLVMAFTKGTAPEIDYHIFACGVAEEFLVQDTTNIETAGGLDLRGVENIKVEHIGLIDFDKETVYKLLEEAFELGYEGLMFRDPDKQYDFKRSDAMLKLKENTASALSEEEISDCLVVDIIYGEFPIIIKDTEGNNYMKYLDDMLLKLRVEQKDETICSVGSGFDLDFRFNYTKERADELIGKVIEVKHQGYGDKGRMRFPRLYRVREDLTWSV